MKPLSFFREELKRHCTKGLKLVLENQGFLSVYSTLYYISLWDGRNYDSRKTCRLPYRPEREIQMHIDRSVDKCKLKIEHALAESKVVCFPKIRGDVYYTYF